MSQPQAKFSLLQTALIDKPRASEAFRFWYVESLINGAASLADRMLADKQVALGLLGQKAQMSMALDAERQACARDVARSRDGTLNLETDQCFRREASFQQQEIHHQGVNDSVTSAHNFVRTAGIQQQQTLADVKRAQLAKEQFICERDLNTQQRTIGEAERLRKYAEIGDRQTRLATWTGYTENRSALDYQSQLDVIEARLRRDYDETADRLTMASQGLNLIYGYSDEFEPKIAVSESLSLYAAVDYSITWCRNAVAFLAKFSQNDQSFVHQIHLVDIQSSTLKEFAVALEDFPNLTHVRLRGISAYVVGESLKDHFFRCVISPPNEAAVLHHGTADAKVMTQIGAADCILGNVTSNHSSREPDLGGAISLLNISPITHGRSKWAVNLTSLTGAEGPFHLVIELRLTAKPSSENALRLVESVRE